MLGPRREWLLLAAILGAAAFVRLYRIDLTWYFLDQVRDVSTAIGIATGRQFPLVGPLIGWTSGRLGPLYFYLISPPFAFTDNPLAGFVFVALVNVAAVLVCYRFVRGYFGPAVALSASALFAVFPLGVFSSRVLWNPALVPLFTLLFMQSLYAVVVRGRSRAIVGVCAWLAVLTQIHLATAALGGVAVAGILMWRPRLRPLHVLAGAGAFVVLYAPYIGYELTHQFENARAILHGVEQPGTGQRALPGVLWSLAVLYRPAIDGFVVADPWPRLPLRAFSALYRLVAVAFCAGVALSMWRVVRRGTDRSAPAVALRRSTGLLLLWLAIPVAVLGTRRTALWWYYFDLLYPSPFIFAGIALSAVIALAPAATRARRAMAGSVAAVVVAVMLSQAWFQIGLQRRIERQGQLVFDVPRFSVASASAALGILPSLPYGYRARLLGALVNDLGMPADALAQRVHGTVLGRPDENEHLVRYLAQRSGRREPGPAAPERHYLVTEAGAAAPGLRRVRAERIGPYAVIEYQPIVDYGSWRCMRQGRGVPAAHQGSSWQRLALPATGVAIELGEGRTLRCEGTLRIPEGLDRVEVVVSVIGLGSLHTVRGELGRGPASPVRERSWQSPSLYWTSEAVFELRAVPPGDTAFAFEVAGSGQIIGLDVYE